MTRFHTVLPMIATLILAVSGEAQVLTPSRARVDTFTRLPTPAPISIVAPTSGVRICLDCGDSPFAPAPSLA